MRRSSVAFRIGVTVSAIVVVEAIVFGLAALPIVFAWEYLLLWAPEAAWPRRLLFSIAAVPSYAAFTLILILVSPLAARVTGARTSSGMASPIRDFDWVLMQWARYMVGTHLVRLFAGSLFRGSPIWTFYLRLNGARIGRRVYINTLFISDHNLLEIGDDVVVGGDVHLSGHTVEGGIVKTAPVRIGRGVTVGLDSIIDIGADLGDGCQVAARSFVPKHAKLEPGGLYAGVPVHRIDSQVSAAR